MSGPARGMWGPAGQPGGGLNHLEGSTGGRADSTHAAAFNLLTNVAHQLLCRTGPGGVIPANINVPSGPSNIFQDYTVWYILDQAVCDELRRMLAFAPVRYPPFFFFFFVSLFLIHFTHCPYSPTSAVSLTSTSALVVSPRTTPSLATAFATTLPSLLVRPSTLASCSLSGPLTLRLSSSTLVVL
jgi:hypothetical protein